MIAPTKLVYKGSVKNVFEGSTKDSFIFEYSDRYSIFDWGEMPDQISNKGQALNLMGYAFFKYLEKEMNLKHHMLGLVGAGLTNLCEVQKINVVRPVKTDDGYNYSAYQDRLVNALVPLEVIFRLGLPEGNSLSKRLNRNPEMIKDFGLSAVPAENKMLSQPIIDFSTKLENGDRYLTYQEARKISGMSENEFIKLQTLTKQIALKLSDLHTQMGLELWDGKVEFAFIQNAQGADRDFMLVDSIGIDELRIISEGRSLSKEFLREVYKTSSWYQALQAAKFDAKTVATDFREICKTKYNQVPEKLSAQNKQKAESLYQGYCNSVFKQLNLPLPFSPEFTVQSYVRNYL